MQIRHDEPPVLIWIQTVWYSNDVLKIEMNQQITKKSCKIIQHARLEEPSYVIVLVACMQSYPVGPKCLSHWNEQLNGEGSLARLRMYMLVWAFNACIYIIDTVVDQNRSVMTCYLAPWCHSWLSDQFAFNNSESLNETALPHIKIQCSVNNISGGM